MTIKYGKLKQRNPEYMATYWKRCRAFYAGGPSLLENKRLLSSVFPKHREERDEVYKLRMSMAYYLNYSGEIIDHLTSKLATDPLMLKTEKLPKWYETWVKDTSPAGGLKKPFEVTVREAVQESLITRTTWHLVDLPGMDAIPESLLEQEAMGGLDAYTVQVPAESVVDWHVDRSGELVWALIMYKHTDRASLGDSRDVVTEEYWEYTRDSWQRMEISYPVGDEPEDGVDVPTIASGTHTLGKVPLVRMTLPQGLWAMAKLEAVAREHLNKRCALSWSEYKSLLPVLYEFLAPDNTMAMLPGGPDRAVVQPRTPSTFQERQNDDRVEWVSPDPGPFDHALTSCDSLRDEMHRVVHQMALSTGNSAAAHKRSGKSKEQDKDPENVVLKALGEIARDFAKELLEMVALARGEFAIVSPEIILQGYSKFVDLTNGDFIEEESLLDTGIDMPSATFKKIRKLALAKRALHDLATTKDFEDIEKELDRAFSTENELAAREQRQGLADPDTDVKAFTENKGENVVLKGSATAKETQNKPKTK